MKGESLHNHFLIAMPAMTDPNFARTVMLLCEHNEQGAMGLVINRPIDLQLLDVFSEVGIDADHAHDRETTVYFGGPVQTNRGFVVHEPAGHWDSTLRLGESLGITTSRDVLQAIAEQRGPDRYLVTLGYAGWSPGNWNARLWRTPGCTARPTAPSFSRPRPSNAGRRRPLLVGVDLATLSGQAGHA